MNKKALITGITGQDGAYLAELLISLGYKVYGGYRKSSSPNFWRLEELNIKDSLQLIDIDILDVANLSRVLMDIEPDEVYNLAAQSFVAVSFDKPILTGNITGMSVTNILEAIRIIDPHIKFYQASSSEMFGKVQEVPQKETTPFYPRSPYGIAKLYGHWMTVNYRESYDMFATSGILFNHESPLRGIEFVSRKISTSVAKIHQGVQDYFEIGNMDLKRDWGYAKEYIKGMWMMLQQEKPDDYVLSTGESHSIREFIEMAFSFIGQRIIWHKKAGEEIGIDEKTGCLRVKVNPKYFRPAEVDKIMGDYSKAQKELGWEPMTKFGNLVELMIRSDVDRMKKNKYE